MEKLSRTTFILPPAFLAFFAFFGTGGNAIATTAGLGAALVTGAFFSVAFLAAALFAAGACFTAVLLTATAFLAGAILVLLGAALFPDI
jgi:hypothetical protein